MKLKVVSKNAWTILKKTFNAFMDDDVLRLSASLSYYTTFALPPLLIIIISICGIFFGDEAVRGQVFKQINGFVGNDAAKQIQEILKNVTISGSNTLASIIGIILLLIGASGVFSELQSSLNYIWGLKAKPKQGLVKFLKNRLMSFSMIGSVAFLLLVSLMINTLLDLLSNRIMTRFPDVTVYVFYVINVAIVFLIITLLFAIIFKSLPDGKIGWKDSLIGASITAVLFMIGKFAIGAYLGSSKVASTYGAAGSVILILAWVYYSAIILYFGAEFTKSYLLFHRRKIIPYSYSVEIEKTEPEKPKKTKPQ
ncbi:MAG: putative ribonuclease [Bacteroidota bacterium]|nr:putative ribonuclease [Bacteroidota bacterium]